MLNVKYSFTIVLLLMTYTLTACGEEKLRTYSYYKENSEERQKFLEKCNAEAEKGYKPEGNFGKNCETAYQVKQDNSISSISRAIRSQ